MAAALPEAELFLYPGDRPLFTDNGLAAHDEQARTLVLERARALLDGVG